MSEKKTNTARWMHGNVGKLPLEISPWGVCDDDELNVGDYCCRLKCVAIFAYAPFTILIVVEERDRRGLSTSLPNKIYRAEDWPTLCAWQLHRDFDWPEPEQDDPEPYLVRTEVTRG